MKLPKPIALIALTLIPAWLGACSQRDPSPPAVAPVTSAPPTDTPTARPAEPTPTEAKPAEVKPADTAPVAPAAGELTAASVIGKVGDTTITLGEVDALIADEIARQRQQFDAAVFDARRGALDQKVSNLVLEAEAKARGTTVDALIEAEVTSKLPPLEDAEVAAFYEQYKGQMEGAPLEQMAPRIRDYLGQQRRDKRQREVMAELRKKHGAKVLLQPPRAEIEAAGPSKGKEGAKISLVIFSDFECPFCSRAVPALQEVEKTYPNDVRFFFRHSPLPFHAAARPAHEASVCAAEQNRFWELHDHLFTAKELGLDKIRAFLTGLSGFDGAAYDACMTSGRAAKQVDADLAAAQKAQVDGTPAFFINGIKISGAQPFSAFQDVIEAELAR